MSFAALSLSWALTATDASAGLWVGNEPARTGWIASNQDGFCSLKRVEETDEATLEFLFVSDLRQNKLPKHITFQVNASPAKLGWPMRFSVGSDPTQPAIVLGVNPAAPIRLSGAEVQRLLAYLKAGHGMDVTYLLDGNVEVHLYLDTYNFPQSIAMFEACTAYVA